MTPEKKLEQKVVAYCKQHGIYCRKFVSPQQRGVPDRILIKNGRVLFLELKAPGKEPTALQERELSLLQLAGVEAHWSDDWDYVRFLICDALDL